MKESELKEHERIALNCYRLFEKQKKDGMLIKTSKTGELYKFGKEIAEKLEPEIKPVDMSVLVNSGIDCLFSMRVGFDNSPVMCHLKCISPNGFTSEDDLLWNYCKPRMNYWFSTENFKNVKGLMGKLEEAGFELEVMYKTIYIMGSDYITAITAFTIKGLQDGYCWPWEVE